MLNNDWAMVSQVVQTEVGENSVEKIRILNAQGMVRVSSVPGDVGERIERSQPACQFCHYAARPGNQTTILTSKEGQAVLLNVNLIRNRPQCFGCHDPQTKVLGFLMIEKPLVELQGQLAASVGRIALSALATFALLMGMIVLALRRFVTQPVDELTRDAAAIGAGNLDHQVRVSSHDELGGLAESFDTMRQQLRASRVEMERHNQELSMLNDITMAASQSLDLQEILDLALDTVVNRLGMQAGSIYMLDRDASRFTLCASRGVSDTQHRKIEHLRQQPGGDISQRVAQTGEAIFIPDMAAEDRFRGLWDDLRGRSYVNVPLKSKGVVVGTMGLVTYAGRPLTEKRVEVLKAVGNEIGIAADNASLLAEAHRHEQEATTLHRLGAQISASLELTEVLNAVAEASRQMLAADIGAVGLLDDKREEVLVKATAGARTESLKHLRVPVRDQTPGSILTSGQPIVIEVYKPNLLTPHDIDLIAAEGIVSLLVVPLQRGERMLGLIGVMTRQRRHFSKSDVLLLTRLAHQVVVAIENAQLYQQVRHIAVLEERDRLAREMHDYLAQALGYLNLKATITDGLLSDGQPTQARDSLLELKQIAKETYTDVREAVFSLRTTMSSGLGLLPTLREYLAEYRTHYGVDARLAVENETLAEFPTDVGVQVIRIIQEALTNVRRHAGASKVWIRFEQDSDQVRISVEDDGQGFDPTRAIAQRHEHFGLQIMRERAESVGGDLKIDSHPGQGTRISLWVPITPKG